MKRLFLIAALASGCATVTSSTPSVNNATGEAWYTETIGIPYFAFSGKVWYCPPPATGPARCKEAKMVKLAKK